ncbi:MAG: cytochrome c [Isosphaerales bacterium]
MSRFRTIDERPARFTAALSRLRPLLFLLAAGCDLPGRPMLSGRPVPADQVVDFNVLYGRNCAGCHGAKGKLGPAPPLDDTIFLSIIPDETLLRVISEGRPGTPMPAFARDRGGPLTDTQVRALAGGIKLRWGPPQKSAGTAVPYSVVEGVNAGDKGRGAKVFARACAACHGPVGEGGEHGDRPVGAINDPAFLALISDQALRRYAITGRPDLGMPDYADKAGRSEDYQPMTSGEIADLVALLASWRQGEAPDTRVRSGPGSAVMTDETTAMTNLQRRLRLGGRLRLGRR